MRVLDHIWKKDPNFFVLIVTGYDHKTALNGLDLEGKPLAYVGKPVKADELIHLVSRRPLWRGFSLPDAGAKPK
jgi:DNA-binding NarL/FixJ family response regulator